MASLERGRIPSPCPIAAREIPLVNRVQEMKLLKEAVDRTIQGEGGLVFLYGEAGIGKTRLARELRAYAHLRGMQVLYGRCPALFRMDGVPPYILWKEVIKDYLETCTPEQLYRVIGYYPAEVAKLVPELVQKLRTIPQSFPIGPEQEQNRLFEAVYQFITNISHETPLLVVLDDLQWTDPSSLLLLHYLARGVQKTSLLLFGAYRSTDIDDKHPLTSVLAELNRERLPQELQLKRMSFGDVSEMIKSILEQDDIPTDFCKLVYDKTRGNPFFAEEVVKSLKEEEAIYEEEGKWKFKEISAIEFPKSVKNVVKARFSRLDDECQNVLTFASFVGNDFTLEAVSALTGIEENKLLEIMDRLIKTGFVKHTVIRGKDICSFADIIMRDVVYEEVGPFKRKKLHGVVGEALEKVYADKIDEHLGELALHFVESGDKEKALSYFLKAGEKAMKIYASSEATSYFQSALMLLEGREDKLREKSHVLESLGDINSILAEYKNSMRFFNEALLLWKQLDEKRKAADVHRKIAGIFWSVDGNVEKAMEHYNEALEILKAEPESAESALLHRSLGALYLFTGNLVKALSYVEKALDLSKRIEQFDTMARSYTLLGTIFSVKGETMKASEYLERALKIALDNNYSEHALSAYNNLAVSLPAEENERRLECLEKAYELAKKAGIIGSISLHGDNLALAYMTRGDTKKALLLAEESLELAKKVGDLRDVSFSNVVLGLVYIVLGELDKSEQCFKQALAFLEKTSFFIESYICYGGLGSLYYSKGEYVRAREFFEKMYDVLEKTGAKPLPSIQMYYDSCYALSLIELGELEKAKSIIDMMYESARPMNDKGLIASADALRAAQFRAEKKWQEAIDLFERSFQEFEALDWRRWESYYFAGVLTECARTYLERDQKDDREKAHNLLNQALEIFQKTGAKKDIEKTMSLLEALHPSSTQTTEEPVGPERYEYADVKSKVIVTPKELKVGESLELEIEVTNTRKEGVILLTKMTEVIPEGFAIAKKPESYRVEGNCLNMREKRLDPLKTEEVKLVLTPKIKGTFHLKPKIVYLDENGEEKSSEPKPVSITVRELGIKGWLKGES